MTGTASIERRGAEPTTDGPNGADQARCLAKLGTLRGRKRSEVRDLLGFGTAVPQEPQLEYWCVGRGSGDLTGERCDKLLLTFKSGRVSTAALEES